MGRSSREGRRACWVSWACCVLCRRWPRLHSLGTYLSTLTATSMPTPQRHSAKGSDLAGVLVSSRRLGYESDICCEQIDSATSHLVWKCPTVINAQSSSAYLIKSIPYSSLHKWLQYPEYPSACSYANLSPGPFFGVKLASGCCSFTSWW